MLFLEAPLSVAEIQLEGRELNMMPTFDVAMEAERMPAPLLGGLLDAEKAFSKVHWEFLIATLKCCGLPEEFIGWMFLKYPSPVSTD